MKSTNIFLFFYSKYSSFFASTLGTEYAGLTVAGRTTFEVSDVPFLQKKLLCCRRRGTGGQQVCRAQPLWRSPPSPAHTRTVRSSRTQKSESRKNPHQPRVNLGSRSWEWRHTWVVRSICTRNSLFPSSKSEVSAGTRTEVGFPTRKVGRISQPRLRNPRWLLRAVLYTVFSTSVYLCLIKSVVRTELSNFYLWTVFVCAKCRITRCYSIIFHFICIALNHNTVS